jgi:hypothetical protein
MSKKLAYTTNSPSSTTDYVAADGTWKPIPGGSGGGDMSKSTYDTDNDGVVDAAETIRIIVRNSTGATLGKGQIVYLSGATGNRPNALLAKADAEATSSKTIGMVTANIANNADGYVAVNGSLHDLDTSAFTAGDTLWLSATTAGGMVANTPPAEPNHSVFIGYVARSSPTLGRVVLAIQNGYELTELHGVEITSVANNDILKYNSTSGLWENSNALSGKQDTITGAATSIVSSNLTASRALISDGSGKVATNAVTSTELGYLSGVTSAIQTQLNSKVSSGGGTSFQTIVGSATGLAATTTRYGNVAGTTAESQNRLPISVPCIMSDLYVRTTATMNASASLAVTIFKNGVATAVTLTIAGGSAAGTYSNTANSVTFAAGDGFNMEYKNVGSAAAAASSGTGYKITI